MVTKKFDNPTPTPKAPKYVVEGCSFVNNSGVNEHTGAAIKALAKAASDNAIAIAEIAKGLQAASTGNWTGLVIKGK